MDDPTACELIDELNELEQLYGRVPASKNPNLAISGEVLTRVELLKQELSRMGVELVWTGEQYRDVRQE